MTDPGEPDSDDRLDGAAPPPKALGMPLVATLGILAAILMVFALPAFLMAAVGLLPSLLAIATDDTPRRQASRCVFAMNLAGVIPIAAIAAQSGNELSAATNMLTNVYIWLAMYGAAACGWGLLWLGPILAEGVVQHLVERETRRLQKRHADLVSEWGRGVLED